MALIIPIRPAKGGSDIYLYTAASVHNIGDIYGATIVPGASFYSTSPSLDYWVYNDVPGDIFAVGTGSLVSADGTLTGAGVSWEMLAGRGGQVYPSRGTTSFQEDTPPPPAPPTGSLTLQMNLQRSGGTVGLSWVVNG